MQIKRPRRDDVGAAFIEITTGSFVLMLAVLVLFIVMMKFIASIEDHNIREFFISAFGGLCLLVGVYAGAKA